MNNFFYFWLFIFLLTPNAIQAETIKIPLHLDKYNQAIIDLKIAGKSERFILDTGSYRALHIPEGMMSAIPGLKLTGKEKSIDLEGKQREMQQFIIPKLDIDGMVFFDLAGEQLHGWGLSIDVGSTNESPDFNVPVVGLGLFKEHWTSIDYKEGFVSISDTEFQDDDGWVDVPYELLEEGLNLKLTDDDKSYVFVLDTGATMSMLKAGSLAKNTKLIAAHEYEKWADIDPKDLTGLWLKKLQLQAFESKPVYYALVLEDLPDEFKADGLLGTDFFESVAIRFNIKQERLQLKLIN